MLRHIRTGRLYDEVMASETTYSHLRANLAEVLNRVAEELDIVIVRRKGTGKDVALIPAGELASLLETAHLLRSPNNAGRLLGALERANEAGASVGASTVGASTVAQLRAEVLGG